jgi:hypothetical protein
MALNIVNWAAGLALTGVMNEAIKPPLFGSAIQVAFFTPSIDSMARAKFATKTPNLPQKGIFLSF